MRKLPSFFLLVFLFMALLCFAHGQADVAQESDHYGFEPSETSMQGDPPVCLTTTTIFLDSDFITQDHLTLPAIAFPLSSSLVTGLCFNIYDRNTQQNLEVSLDKEASHVSDPLGELVDSAEEGTVFHDSSNSWITSTFDSHLFTIQGIGHTTLIYHAVVPSYEEGEKFIPERSIRIEIPLTIEKKSITATRNSSGNTKEALITKNQDVPVLPSKMDDSSTSSTEQSSVAKTDVRTWNQWWDQRTPVEQASIHLLGHVPAIIVGVAVFTAIPYLTFIDPVGVALTAITVGVAVDYASWKLYSVL